MVPMLFMSQISKGHASSDILVLGCVTLVSNDLGQVSEAQILTGLGLGTASTRLCEGQSQLLCLPLLNLCLYPQP